jgi:predicted nucleotidyltransferase
LFFAELTKYALNKRYPDYKQLAFKTATRREALKFLNRSQGDIRVVADIEAVRIEARRYAAAAKAVTPIDRAYLFGSYAKGTARKLSDVDIAFFFYGLSDEEIFKFQTRLIHMTLDFTGWFEPLAFSTSDLDTDNPFVSEILRTGIEL